jgi:hypothetical protein
MARASRPLTEIPRYLLTRREAAASLGMSVQTFERRVQPFVKLVRIGQLVLVSPTGARALGAGRASVTR